MTSVLITSVTGTRSWMRSSESGTQIGTLWNANGTQMERKWNADGTRMEREWNANGTHLRARSGRVPNAFSVRLFLSSTVCTMFVVIYTYKESSILIIIF